MGGGGGGGGGGGAFYRRSPEDLQKIIRQTEDKTTVAKFETELSETLGGLLAEYNGRDHDLTRERLDAIKSALEGEVEGSFDQLFGGSVAKHTHVEGMSDIDSLVLIDDSELEGKGPDVVLAKIERIIGKKLGPDASVSHGRMAVSIQYSDGMLIQVLPAINATDGHLHVPSSRNYGWSKINPVAFTKALTRRNQECGNKLIPTIKLAKAINGQLPEAQRLSGYHMESIGIAAFKGYDGTKSTATMLPHFFERARELVLSPIKDKTGQSVHVDDYLGPANSPQRVAASHVFDRLAPAGCAMRPRASLRRNGSLFWSGPMTATEGQREELGRIRRVADMMCTGHAGLRDHYARRGMALDLAILALTTWLAAIAFIAPRINVSLTPFGLDPQIWVGFLSVGTLFLAIVQLKTDWKSRADAHRRSLDIYAEVKREAGYVLAKGDFKERDFVGVIERFNMASAVGIAIPENQFLRQKKRHKVKVAISKFLDDHPGASILVLQMRLWIRDTLTKDIPRG